MGCSKYCIYSCNQPKSLSGIETSLYDKVAYPAQVAINLNPYQGLKQIPIIQSETPEIVAINLNPYQGLKQTSSFEAASGLNYVAINLNPYQGLKQFLRLSY